MKEDYFTLKLTKVTIPVLAAGLVITARTADNTPQAQQPSNGSQERSQSSQKEQKLSQGQRNQQSTFQPGPISDSQLKKAVTEVNKASSFIGMTVKNVQNEELGKVHDLVFDPESSRISYAVISVGGVLGVGDKLLAVPVNSLKPQPGQKHLVLNMDKNQLESSPGLAQNNWPDLDSPALGAAAGSESSSSSATSDAIPGKASEDTSSSNSGANPGSNSDARASSTPGSSESSISTAKAQQPGSSEQKDGPDQ